MTDRYLERASSSYWINFSGSMVALAVGVWLGIRSWKRADP